MNVLAAEKLELQATVDAQEISPADVDRMNSERDQLIKSLEILSGKLDEINKEIWDKEIQIQKKMDHVITFNSNYSLRNLFKIITLMHLNWEYWVMNLMNLYLSEMNWNFRLMPILLKRWYLLI